MAMSRVFSLPEEIAAREHVSIEELVSAAIVEHASGADHWKRRAERADVERDQIPDVEPEPHDRLY
jgi:hypothetical protein